MKRTDPICSTCCVQLVPPLGRQTAHGAAAGMLLPLLPRPSLRSPCGPRSVPPASLYMPGRAQAFVLQFDCRQLHSSLLCRFKISDFLFLASITSISLSTWTVLCWTEPLITLTSGGEQVYSLTVVTSMNFGYQDIQAWLVFCFLNRSIKSLFAFWRGTLQGSQIN